MSKKTTPFPKFSDRAALLRRLRNLKMAESAHAYVRGNVGKSYEWLASADTAKIPQGPSIWIGGDCHLSNIGPIADVDGEIDIQIRDLDQTVIGNPAHDLIRLGLSLATAARGSDLPGVTTARMLGELSVGYEEALVGKENDLRHERPKNVEVVMRKAVERTWENLANDRIENTKPTIPLGKKFWPLTADERREIDRIFATDEVRRLVTSLRYRKDGAPVQVLDAAYWVKGCSSLGRLRYAVLVGVGKNLSKKGALCLIDIKEAVRPGAPRAADMTMPRDNAVRVATGAKHLSPGLGERVLPARFLDKAVFLRELLPQDLKLEVETFTREEAVKAARYLGRVVGVAHARQMEDGVREKWREELARHHPGDISRPAWLWSCVVELASIHEAAYLDHCRRYDFEATTAA
jgi:uncharacterized protein (DUF2252 family)